MALIDENNAVELNVTRKNRVSTEVSTEPRRARVATEEATEPRRARVATEEATEPRRAHVATEEATEPRRAHIATEEATEPRRAHVATEEATEPRRAHVATEEATEPRRARVATEEATEPRCARVSTEEETEPRRTRVATEENTTPRREETNSENTAFSRVFSRVHSSLDIGGFFENAAKLKTLTGESGSTYTVKKVLSDEGGEAIILLCSDESGNDVVAKVFMRAEGKGKHSLAAREKIFDYMQTEVGKRTVLAVSDFGTAQVETGFQNYFEIMPYCAGGDMLGIKLSFDELVPVIKELNESLHAIHNEGIIHLDLKPDNLYKQDGRIVIGDFGIARTTDKVHTYTAVGTDGYRAPETVLAPTAGKAAYVLGPFCDYYSLGVTLACLYEGHYIFEDVDPAEVTYAIMNSHMPLTYHDDPHQEQLEKLIDGLVQYDHHRRFKYEDVVNWLQDHNYTGAQADDIWPRAFTFEQKKHKDEQQLFSALTANENSWNEGKYFLYSKTFEDFFRSFRPDLARTAQILEEQYRTDDQDVGLARFLKALYLPGGIVWRGYRWGSLAELAEKMMQTNQPKSYGEILQKRMISHWLENTTGIIRAQDSVDLVHKIEDVSQTYPEIACYWFGFAFAELKKLDVCGDTINDIAMLFDKAFSSAKKFYCEDGVYSQLMDSTTGAKLYGFLCSYGHCDKIEKTLKESASNSEHDKYQLILAMLEVIGQEERIDMDLFEQFYLNYGPLATASYIYKIQKAEQIYKGLNSVGEDIVRSLESVTLPEACPIEECRAKMQQLLELTTKLEQQLQNNPFLTEAGVYGNSAVACTDLRGYFAYSLMGRNIPMGLASSIDEN